LIFAGSIVTSVAFIPLVVLTGKMASLLAAPQLLEPFFWVLQLVTGVLGCVVAWLSLMLINVTSLVTLQVASDSKAVAQSVIAVIWYHETKRTLGWISVLLVVCGTFLYAVVRTREENSVQQPQTEPLLTATTNCKPPDVKDDDDDSDGSNTVNF